MHTCSEARQFTIASARSGIRFRPSRLAGCPVPFRLFRPELDALYIGCDAQELLSSVSYAGGDLQELGDYAWPEQDLAVVSVLQQARHLAVPLYVATDTTENLMSYIRELATETTTLSLIVPGSTYQDTREYSPSYDLRFKQPARRCRLRPMSLAEMDTNRAMPGPESELSQTNLSMDEPQRLNDIMRAMCESDLIDFWQLLDAGVQTLIQTFEERQPDGTYAETCQDRRYIHNLVFGDFPLANLLSWEEGPIGATLRAAPFLHPLERPDPQTERVNDIDSAMEFSAATNYWIDADGKLGMGAIYR